MFVLAETDYLLAQGQCRGELQCKFGFGGSGQRWVREYSVQHGKAAIGPAVHEQRPLDLQTLQRWNGVGRCQRA